jgi:glutamine synthetase
MNTMLADSLSWIADKLDTELAGGTDKPAAVIAVLKDLMVEHGAVIFGGDGYSAEWHRMAVEDRGLKNLPTTADALPYLQDESVKALFASTGVLSEVELKSRYEVYAEIYVLSMAVEANLVADMAKTIIYPAAMKYLSDLASASTAAAALGITSTEAHMQFCAGELRGLMDEVRTHVDALELEVADEQWPLPKYREMLFIK